MQTAMAIARRELRTYFYSPIAYIFLGVFLALGGVLLFILSGFFIQGRASLRYYFDFAPILMTLLAPAVTMRLIAEERRSRTIEVLLTLPVRDWDVVLGKFLGAMGLITVGLLFTLAYPLSISLIVADGFSFDWGPVVGGYVGTWLMSASFVALGMWASALSQDQVVAFIVGLILCLVSVFVGKVAILFPASVADLVQYLSVSTHFESVARGVLDTRDLVYFLTLIAIGLALTTRTLGRVRQ
jgi:ABC-2 type transport system permease protein